MSVRMMISPEEKKREMLKCKRCNYVWFSRVAFPALCPRCKSPYWNCDKTQHVDRVSKYYEPEDTEGWL